MKLLIIPVQPPEWAQRRLVTTTRIAHTQKAIVYADHPHTQKKLITAWLPFTEVARVTGLSPRTVAYWFHHNGPHINENFYRLCQFYGITIDQAIFYALPDGKLIPYQQEQAIERGGAI